jgi:DNA/RNA endonuclease G (NUC1)
MISLNSCLSFRATKLRAALALSVAVALLPVARATVQQGLQLLLGNPSSAAVDANNHSHYLLDRPQYALDYNDTTHESNWVSWNLTSADSLSGRTDAFAADPDLPTTFTAIDQNGYRGSGYDRGHMCPSADRNADLNDNRVTFYMTNMVPQTADNNQGVWASFETYCRSLAASGNELLIISGPSGFGGSTIASGVAIPGYTWKIVLVVPLGAQPAINRINASTRVIAIKIPNIAGVRNNPWAQYITTIAQLESDTGFDFLRAVEALPGGTTLASTLRFKFDGQSLNGAPIITLQPASQSAPVGGNATFTVAANDGGNPPLSYQWFKDDVEIADATSATLSLTNVGAADLGSYSVIISNSVGAVTSNSAALAVTGLPPVITSAPTMQIVPAGSTAIFNVTAVGSPPLGYVWRKAGVALVNGGRISGANTATLRIANVQDADEAPTATGYDVLVTSGGTTIGTNAVALDVTDAPPAIVTHPVAQTVTAGNTATFTVVASGTDNAAIPLTYQWMKNGADIAGATSAELKLTNVQKNLEGNYSVRVQNALGTVVSAEAKLDVTLVLLPGDIAIIGRQNGATDIFVFVNLVPLSAGQVIYFTDNGWSNSPTAPGFRLVTATDPNGAEDLMKFTAVQTIPAGTIISSIDNSNPTKFTWSTSGPIIPTSLTQYGIPDFAAAGDQIYAFTSSAVNPALNVGTHLFVLDDTAAFEDATSSNTGAVPPGLTAGSTALNFQFGTATTRAFMSVSSTALASATGKSRADWLAAFANPTNWTFGATGTFPTAALNVLPAPPPSLTSTAPLANATNVPINSDIVLTFNQSVRLFGSWFTLTGSKSGPLPATVRTSADGKTVTLTAPALFANSETVTLQVFAAQVTDVTGALALTSNATLTFSTIAAIPPSILASPVAQTVAAGSTVTFSVTAAGNAPLVYQWHKNGVNVANNPTATTANLVLANVQAGDDANYDVTISNGIPPAVSTGSVHLTVNPAAPIIVAQPTPQSAPVGGTAVFNVVATGTEQLGYTWRKGGVPLVDGAFVTGAHSPTLTLSDISLGDSGNYDVVVSNGLNPDATSNAVALTAGVVPPGQFAYLGGSYVQNFNSLPAAAAPTFAANGPFRLDDPTGVNAAGLAGWSFAKYAGSGTTAVFKVDNGSANNGAIYSYGATTTPVSTERALGSVGSGSTSSRFGLVLVNNTGQPITQFTLGYTGEQWRHGGAATPNKLSFSYAVGATDINTGTFTAATSLDFIAPITTADTTALDGNASANRGNVLATVGGFTWAPGQTLVLRWSDVDDSGSDDGLAVDDLTFSTPIDLPVAPAIATTSPASGATNVDIAATITLNFDRPTRVSGTWFAVTSAAHGPIAATASGGPTTFTLTPAAPLPYGDIVTVTVLAAQVSDLFTGTQHPASDTTFSFSTIPLIPVAIQTAPSASPATVGDNVSLSVVATGTAPLTYQWSKGGSPLTGAIAATLALNAITTADAGEYTVAVTNPAGTVTSSTTLDVQKATVGIALSGLTQTYTGAPRAVTVTTVPGLAFELTYNDLAGAPVNAGDYAVKASIVDANYMGTVTGTLHVSKASGSVALGNLTFTYDGTAHAVTASSTPPGLSVGVTYNDSAAVPINAGSYAVVATIHDLNYEGAGTATLKIEQATATLTLGAFATTYDGTPKSVTSVTTPAGLSVALTYDGSATAPIDAGTYVVAGSITDPNYSGSATGQLVIAKATPSFAWSNLSQIYDGTPKSPTVTTTPSGLSPVLTFDSSSSAPTNAGTYAVVASVNTTNYAGTAANTFTITKASATIELAGLVQTYDGEPRPVTATTTPAGLGVAITYDGESTAPTRPGAFEVVATITDPNYSGTATGRLHVTITSIVRHAPSINGDLDGSLQLLLPESFTLNGGAMVSGDVLVPGLPVVRVNGSPLFAGVIDGTGLDTPTDYQVTLNNNAVLRHVVRRTNGAPLSALTAPPAATGTRSVTLNSSNQVVTDFPTLLNLTLNGNAGQVAVPAGTYGALVANGSAGFTLGTPDATTPSVYNLQQLVLNGTSSLTIVGPVVINLANGVSINGHVGATGHAEWLLLNVASGGVTLNNHATLDAYVVAPSGTVSINSGSVLRGRVAADRLTINSGGVLAQP